MSLIPTLLPSAYTPPFQSGGNAQKNAESSSTHGRANQPWLCCVAQTLNSHTITDSSSTIVGFDTVLINTYKAVNGQQYKLQFTSQTISGHAYPDTFITLPQYGYYHAEWAIGVTIDGATASNEQLVSYLVVSSQVRLYSDTCYNTIGTTDPGMVVHGGGYFLGEPGDTVNIQAQIINPVFAYSGSTINQSPLFYLHLRYLGTAG